MLAVCFYRGLVASAIGFAVHDRSRRLRVDADAGHQPYYTVAPFAALGPLALGDVAPAAVNTVVFPRNIFSYGANTSFEQSVGRRSSISLNGGFHRIEY